MNEQHFTSDSSGRLTPRSLLAVALVYLAVSYISSNATLLLAFITGPFASAAVGVILLIIARRIYRGENLLQ